MLRCEYRAVVWNKDRRGNEYSLLVLPIGVLVEVAISGAAHLENIVAWLRGLFAVIVAQPLGSSAVVTIWRDKYDRS
jgi:hypothetical protein